MPYWTPSDEVTHSAEALSLATSLVPAAPTESAPIIVESARRILAHLLRYRPSPQELTRWLRHREDIVRRLAGTDLAHSLDRQTPWITPKDRTVVVEIRAKNEGDTPVDALTVAVGLGTAVRTRGTYEASLQSGPAITPYARSFAQNGSLAPNQARAFTVKFDLATSSAISHTESLIYPMKVSVLSHGLLVSNELRAPVISLARKPDLPLAFSWTVDVSSPPLFGPDGRLASTSIEASLAPGGALRSEVDALSSIAAKHVPANVVVLPLLLDDLRRMGAGYTRADGTVVKAGDGGAKNADTVLQELRKVAAAPSSEISAYTPLYYQSDVLVAKNRLTGPVGPGLNQPGVTFNIFEWEVNDAR